jgi:nicotinamidase-related amidase
MTPIQLEPSSTALILIDLQRGIVSRPVAPHAAADVIRRAAGLAEACRRRGALVVLVRVAFDARLRDRLSPPADAAVPAGTLPADWADLVSELAIGPDDLIVTKHQWGAFYGTELELQLRRRGIHTLLLGGISTNFGVESTARTAYELGFRQVFIEDCMASMSAEHHRFPIEHIFPRIGQVRSTAEVLAALATPS